MCSQILHQVIWLQLPHVCRWVVSRTLGDPLDCTPRLLCPWDSPGKNTGVGCHSLLQGIFPAQGPNLGLLHCGQTLLLCKSPGKPHVYGEMCLVAQSCPILWDPMDGSKPGSSLLGDSPGKNTGVGYLALLQGIFSSQRWNPCLPHCRQIPYQLTYQGSMSKSDLSFKARIHLHLYLLPLLPKSSLFYVLFVPEFSLPSALYLIMFLFALIHLILYWDLSVGTTKT